jgi:hypothetical protein
MRVQFVAIREVGKQFWTFVSSLQESRSILSEQKRKFKQLRRDSGGRGQGGNCPSLNLMNFSKLNGRTFDYSNFIVQVRFS